jgi:beta-phosphoglucomutase-like phosphatase (HAD superfamily)
VLDSEGVITAVTSSEDVETAKPEPDIVQVALDRAGAEAVFDNPKDLLDHLDVTRIAALAHR